MRFFVVMLLRSFQSLKASFHQRGQNLQIQRTALIYTRPPRRAVTSAPPLNCRTLAAQHRAAHDGFSLQCQHG